MHRCGFIQPEYCNAHAHLFIIIQFYNCWLVPIVVNGRNVEYGAFIEHTGYHNACDANFAAAIRLCYILTVGHVPHVQIDLQFSSTIPTNHRF